MDVLRNLRRLVGRDLEATVLEEARRRIEPTSPVDTAPVTDADVASLPAAVRRYLTFMGVVGRPRDRSFLARFVGRFRRGDQWMPCEAWQYNTAEPVARIFDMRLDFGGFVPMVGRDSYLDGRGSMHGELLGVFTVANGAGPEFDAGELVTYLNDALVLAPSMLLGTNVTWSPVDDHCFEVAIEDHGHTVSARVLIDDDGALRDFSTLDRFCDLPEGLVRARWTTPIDAWTTTPEGRPVPTQARAIWHLPDGPLPYIEGTFVAASVAYDVRPGGTNPTP